LSRNKLDISRAIAPTWWVSALWLVAAELAQVTVAHVFTFRSVVPSFVLVAVVWYAIRVDATRAAAYGLAAGALEDILGTGTGAAWTISTTIAAVAAQTISRGFFADSLPLVATITVAATLVRQLLFWIVWGFEGYPPGLAVVHFHEAIVIAVLNAIAMIVVMLVARRFSDRYA
jgi:rod shape-determining protein MreD